jgi:uncharacterized iron-regulated membrane protein
MNDLSLIPQARVARPNLHATIWRWHLYAGLFCIPFILFLSLSGAVYLFKPQVEAWLDRPYDRVAAEGALLPVEAQVRAALAAVPGARLSTIEVRPDPRDAARIGLVRGEQRLRAYVHPATGAALKVVDEADRPMAVVKAIHGELLLGERGSLLVELAASWAIVMVLSGLYLWWPRGRRRLAGVLYPRLTARGRLRWRDLHAVTGVWISLLALFLLVSGLPWTTVWGEGFRQVRVLTGTAAEQDWSTRRRPGAMAGGHAEHGAAGAAHGTPGVALAPMKATARRLDLPSPVLLSPPRGGSGPWLLRSDTQNRPKRVTVKLDPASGAVIGRQDFADRHVIDRVVGYAIAAHEGQLFGPINQLLGVFTALGLVTVSASGAVMWWRRRPTAISPADGPSTMRVGWLLGFAIAVLGLLLPLFGFSVILILLIDRIAERSVAIRKSHREVLRSDGG